MIPQRTMRPSIARVSKQLDLRFVVRLQTYHRPKQPQPIPRKLLLIFRLVESRTLSWRAHSRVATCSKLLANVARREWNPNFFLLLARYVSNVANRSIWDQCNTEDRPTDDRPLFLEEPSWKNFKRPYLHNDARSLVHGHYGPPIGSRPPGVEWSRERWRHVTPKGQGCDPIIFEAPYLRNGARYTQALRYNKTNGN